MAYPRLALISGPMHTSSSVAASARGGRPRRPGKRTRKRTKATKIVNDSATRISGAEIRARIAANRAKRLAIAEAMKREAGVTEHTVHQEDLSGLAYIGTGRILSPEGRKMVQLFTLAHECGHIFLHNAGVGYRLPSHVKELEAETYMHQAICEHGMMVPQWRTRAGRDYIGWWIEQDRAAHVCIDPRAEAYARGQRSPFEALPMVPSTWRSFRAQGSWLPRLLVRLHRGRLADELDAVSTLAWRWGFYGYLASLLAAIPASMLYPEAFPRDRYYTFEQGPFHLVALSGALLLANLAVMWRTLRRR